MRYLDRDTKEMHEVRARVIFLCASTLGTTQIMLKLDIGAFPEQDLPMTAVPLDIT